MTAVRTAVDDGIMTITLNRADKLNAMTIAMYEAVEAALLRADADDAVGLVVLRGEGRSFSAGWDRKEPVPDLAAALRLTNRSRWAIWDCRVPVVLVAQGHCLGGAFELMLPADLVIASQDCLFGMPEVREGATAGFNMLPWLGNHRQAKATMMTAEMFSAQVAKERGLVTHVAPADRLDEVVDEVVAQLRAVPAETLAAIKAQTNAVHERLGMRRMIDDAVDSTTGLELFGG